MSKRRVRVEQSLTRALATSLDQEIGELATGCLTTISGVRLNQDMGVARVGLSMLGGEEKTHAAILERLTFRARKIRGEVARSLGLARSPRLVFVRDESLAFQAHLTDIVRTDEARAQPAAEAPLEQEVRG